MDNYYEQFVQYCLLTTVSLLDFGDKKKKRIHNNAMTKLFKLQEMMYNEPGHCSVVVQDLLHHENDKVKINAAAYCVNRNVNKDQAIEILHNIKENSTDRWIAYSASDVLKYCRKTSVEMTKHISSSENEGEEKDRTAFSELIELEHFFVSKGLKDYFEKQKAFVKNSIHLSLEAQEDKNIQVGDSKIGGTPDLPDEIKWFWHERDKTPLSFICQINFAEIKLFDRDNRLPEKGILYFFYACDEGDIMPWGYDPKDAAGWKVFYYSGDADKLKKGTSRLNQGGAVFSSARIKFTCSLELPRLESSLSDLIMIDKEEKERYYDMLEETGDFCCNKLLGHADSIQDAMELECELVTNGIYCGTPEGYKEGRAKGMDKNVTRWNLLMQIDSNEEIGMMWGDCGRLYLWITDEDLKAKKFENTWVILQCT